MRTAWRRRQSGDIQLDDTSKEGGIVLLDADELPFRCWRIVDWRWLLWTPAIIPQLAPLSGITSPRFGEGKTTVAFNLAKCIAEAASVHS